MKKKTMINKFLLLAGLLFLLFYGCRFNNYFKKTYKNEHFNLEDTLIDNQKYKRKIYYGIADTLDGYWNKKNDTIFFIPQYFFDNNKCFKEPIPIFYLRQREKEEVIFAAIVCGNLMRSYVTLEGKYSDINDTILVFRQSCLENFDRDVHDIEMITFYDKDSNFTVQPKFERDKKRLDSLPPLFTDERLFIYSVKNGIIGYNKLKKSINHCLY